jgi:hypothetical protein
MEVLMKTRRWLVSATCVVLLGVAVLPPAAQALPPPTNAPKQADPFYAQREASASAVVASRLAAERQKIQTNHLNYTAGYTTAMDRPPEALRGALVHADLAQRMAAHGPIADAALRAAAAKMAQGRQGHPHWPTPSDARADLRAVLQGNYTYYPTLSAPQDPLPSGGRGTVPPVKDQANCGSCFAFAPTTLFEWSRLVWQDAFGLSASQSIVVSPQSILSCAYATAGGGSLNECKNGGYTDDAVQWLVQTGAQMESEYAYADSNDCCIPTGYEQSGWTTASWCTPAQQASNFCRNVPSCKAGYVADERAGNWGYLKGAGPIATTDEMKHWIAQFGALSVGVNADGWSAYTGGVYSDSTTGGIDHAVTIIGWDDHAVGANGATAGAWIVQNNWGTGWGGTAGYGDIRGYMYLQYGSSSVPGTVVMWVTP